ncbi:hypothetical protein H8356DRAFT_1362518 [Neocallimastix lanati (nom. inval.)]|nr:hypothetical protein H8356DRAFT_1362518 [Neocallimastix sp. JGI-2020a]
MNESEKLLITKEIMINIVQKYFCKTKVLLDKYELKLYCWITYSEGISHKPTRRNNAENVVGQASKANRPMPLKKKKKTIINFFQIINSNPESGLRIPLNKKKSYNLEGEVHCL